MATTSASNPAEFIAGAIFGTALYSAGVFDPNTILGQMSLQSWDMLQVMLGASATSALIIHLASRLKYAPSRPRSPAILSGSFPYDGNVIGGTLVGLGMALSGACPGTVLVQFGLGLPGSGAAMAGCLLGAAIYQKGLLPLLPSAPRSQKSPAPTDSKAAKAEKVPTLYAAMNLSEQTLLAIWLVLCAVGLVVLRPLRSLTAPDPVLGGLGVGAAQTATILLAKHAIGVSAAYGDFTNLVLGLLPGGGKAGNGGGKADARKSVVGGITPSMAFAAGVLGISALMPKPSGSPIVDVGFVRAFVGGISMVLGARIGGGCTSGHGISGMATFATASVITTAAMFGAGIAGSAGLRWLGF